MTTPTNPPAGWYPDPSNPAQQRYWDGDAWTTHVRANQQVLVAPQTVSPPPNAGGGKRRKFGRKELWRLAAFVIATSFGLAIVSFLSPLSDPLPKSSPSATTADTEQVAVPWADYSPSLKTELGA